MAFRHDGNGLAALASASGLIGTPHRSQPMQPEEAAESHAAPHCPSPFTRDSEMLRGLIEAALDHEAPRDPNPFTCDSDTLRGLLVSLLDDVGPEAGDSVFRGRAVALVGAVAPVLAWVRDHKSIRIDLCQSHFAMELPNLCALVAHKVFRVRPSVWSPVTEVPVADMPEALTGPVQAYLRGLPGYDGRLPGGRQATAAPGELHDWTMFILALALVRGGAAGWS